MRAIRVAAHGGPEVLQLEDVPAPGEPGPGQARVQVIAAGVNFMDLAQQRGIYPRELPFTPGWEAAGIVEAVGEGVSDLRPGDRVAFGYQPGAYAETIVVSASHLVALQDLSFEQGAALLTQGLTAQYVIHAFRRVKAGEFVLVHAAAGGVGGWLVQWARHLGAVVIGTVSSEQKAAAVRALGADHVIVYTSEDFAAQILRITGGHGADLILDGVGRATASGNLAAIAVRGHIVLFGASSGSPEPVAPYPLIQRSISLCGASLLHLDRFQERVDEIIAGIRDGWLKVQIGAVLPLHQARKAHQLLESRLSCGKIILSVREGVAGS